MLTLEEIKELMADSFLPEGEIRRYQKCRQCGEIQVREFIPFAVGRGRTFNPCMCYCTGNDKKGYETLEDVEGMNETARQAEQNRLDALRLLNVDV